MIFSQPFFLFFGALLCVWIWFYSRGSPISRILRIFTAFILSLGLAQPHFEHSDIPIHLVILVDRSPSMPVNALSQLREWLSPAAIKLRPEDEITLVGFTDIARTEIHAKGKWPGFKGWNQVLPNERTNIGNALDTALSILEKKPAGKILLITDGLDQGGEINRAITRAANLGIPIHTRFITRRDTSDVAVEELLGPTKVRVGQPFILTARIASSERVKVKYRFLRGDIVLAQGERELNSGSNQWRFRDVLTQPQHKEYRLEIETEHDAFPENNKGLLLVRSVREKHALVWTQHGEEGVLSHDLTTLGFDVEIRSPQQSPQSAAELSGAKLVVLENVAATDFSPAGLEAFRFYTEKLGGALFITGGKSSFGLGGYYRSPLDPILPVSMEVRKEQRKASIALCIVLDRSGSMAIEASPGVPKIKLANEGTIAALQLLTPNDLVSVIAVDSAPHVIIPLQVLKDPASTISQIRRIESMGGGIFVRTGLVAAMKELENASARTRHIILFADANDSEEQEGVPELIEKFKGMGIIVSVIGLGKSTDSDSKFLIGLSQQAGGTIEFTENPQALPQIFAKETITILRSTFLEEPVALSRGPDLSRLGPNTTQAWSRPGGYNVTYLKPSAGAGLFAEDEQHSPILSFWQHGRGRTAALTLPWEGAFSGEWPQWPGRLDLLGQLTTWLTSNRESDLAQLRWDHSSERPHLVLTLDANSPSLTPKPTALSILGPEGEMKSKILFHPNENNDWVATPDLIQQGHYIATMELNNHDYVISPPYSVAFSPEFDLSHYGSLSGGRLTLEKIMKRTEGKSPARISEIFNERPKLKQPTHQLWLFLVIALFLYLLEIAQERFGWFAGLNHSFKNFSYASIQRKFFLRKSISKLKPHIQSPESQTTQSILPIEKNVLSKPVEESPESALLEAKTKAKKHWSN